MGDGVMSNLIAKAIWAYWEGGLSLVPINSKTKRPYGKLLPQAIDDAGNPLFYIKDEKDNLIVTTEVTNLPKGTWEPYQNRQPTQDELKDWIAAGIQSVAIVGGKVSGGAEILDFDVDGYYERWVDMVGSNIVDNLPRQRTGGGGIQIGFRSEAPQPNQKLAWHPAPEEHSGRRIAIETRGERGYAVLPPSLHPSGNYYTLQNGRFSQVPMISPEERAFLLDCARSLCQAPLSRQELERGPRTPRAAKEYTGDSVIAAYNALYSIETTLMQYGYTECRGGRWSRPGKADSGGVVIIRGENKSYHYSSNDPLDAESIGLHQPRSPFDFFLEYQHAGDYKSAVREAAEILGMNSRQVTQTRPVDEPQIRVGTSIEEIIENRTMAFFQSAVIR